MNSIFIALNMITLVILSYFYFNEPIHPFQLTAIGLIMIGVIILQFH